MKAKTSVDHDSGKDREMLNGLAQTRSPQRANAASIREIADIVTERVVVSPDVAKAWLDRNTKNRKVARLHVDKMARDMKDGRFVFTGDAIRFDTNRVLLDGQHRLLACVAADVPFETLVIYNLPPETQEKIDGGKSRTASDVMSMIGHHNTSHIAAACRLIIDERHQRPYSNNHAYSTSEILDVLRQHKVLPSVVSKCMGARLHRGFSIAQVALVYYVGAYLIDKPEEAEAYFTVLQSGVPAYEGDPAHVFRERIIRDHGAFTVLKRVEKWRMIKHSWNLFAAKQKTKILRVGPEVWFSGLKSDML